jgi:hypothetical protein
MYSIFTTATREGDGMQLRHQDGEGPSDPHLAWTSGASLFMVMEFHRLLL